MFPILHCSLSYFLALCDQWPQYGICEIVCGTLMSKLPIIRLYAPKIMGNSAFTYSFDCVFIALKGHCLYDLFLNTELAAVVNNSLNFLTEINNGNGIWTAYNFCFTHPPRDTPVPMSGASGYISLICFITNPKSSVFAAQYVLGVWNMTNHLQNI